MLENFLWFMGKERRYSGNNDVSRTCGEYHFVEGMFSSFSLSQFSLTIYKVQRDRLGRLVTKSARSSSLWIPSSGRFFFVFFLFSFSVPFHAFLDSRLPVEKGLGTTCLENGKLHVVVDRDRPSKSCPFYLACKHC